jgi:hypothetical protein
VPPEALDRIAATDKYDSCQDKSKCALIRQMGYFKNHNEKLLPFVFSFTHFILSGQKSPLGGLAFKTLLLSHRGQTS